MDTPARVAKMFLNELYWGLDYDNFPKATVVENKMQVDEMVLERYVTVNSTCEHHLLPIIGHAHVAYIAKDKVLGLSKINRIVEFFSRRPQIQERLTSQICETLMCLLDTDDVAVIIEAEHMCVKTRGVEDACSDTVTSKMSGVFKNPDRSSKAEFLAMIALRGGRV
jgi:GTP cyclohydrolase I